MGLSERFVEPAIAVSDLVRAREFYEDKLGLDDPIEDPGVLKCR